jgi:hypothetical protein
MAQRGRPKKQPTITKLDTKDKTNSSNTSESVILTEDYNFASNIRLKKVGVKVALTAAQVKEYKKCADDPVYFIEKYVKFMTLDKGITNVNLYDFQKDLINTYHDNRMVIVKCGRQLGKTSTTTGYLLHYILFNKDKTAAVLAQKEKVANEILSKIKMAYEYIPLWMQQGVVSWNATSIELENGCRILCESTSSGSIRGFTISLLYLDEFAHVPSHVAEDFFTAVYPTISSGKKSKIIITSTPFGLNMYYRFWMDALKEKKDPKNWNGFVPFQMHWSQVPGRNKNWAEQQKKILGEHKYAQDIEAEFLGSSNTLINGKTLRALAFVPELESMFEDSLKVYEKPIKRHTYVISADPSQGKGLDYSAFTVFDVTEAPYQVVARFRNNLTEDIMFANYIVTAAKHYNDAYLIVENNDIGALVLHHIIQEFDYDNLFYSYTDKGNFGELSAGQGVQAKVPGVRTTRKIKTQGCSKLKTIIENQQIILNDFDIISELSTFVLDKTKQYNAEEGYHDDTVSTLWIFAWLTAQPLFKEISDLNLRARLFAERERLAEESLPPVPVIQSNNYKPSPLSIDKSTGTIWINSEQSFDEAIEQLNDWLLDR